MRKRIRAGRSTGPTGSRIVPARRPPRARVRSRDPRWAREPRPWKRGIRLRTIMLAVLGLWLVACAAPTLKGERELTDIVPRSAALQEAGPPRRVILLTVAGLDASDYLDPWGHAAAPGAAVRMPRLAKLAREGITGLAALPPSPGSTRASHATLVTGRSPVSHGIVADAILDEDGSRSLPLLDNRSMRGTALWDAAIGRGVLALDWPTTAGARIELVVPEVSSAGNWLDSIRPRSSPPLYRELEAIAAEDLAASAAADDDAERDPATWPRPSEKDAALVESACRVVDSPRDPGLWLLRLDQTAMAQRTFGTGSVEVDDALRRVDEAIGTLVDCLEVAGQLEDTAIFVVGDVAYRAVYSVVSPNVALLGAGLVGRDPRATSGVRSWLAMSRSNGLSAYVYARDAANAVDAREVLETEAMRTGAFRVVSATDLAIAGADPQAWFGLVAAPGRALADALTGELVGPSVDRGAAGMLRFGDERAAAVGFVAWGRGVRNQLRIPMIDFVDVAPTIATLLGLRLDEDVEGEVHPGLLRAAVEPAPAGPKRLGAESGTSGSEILRDMRRERRSDAKTREDAEDGR